MSFYKRVIIEVVRMEHKEFNIVSKDGTYLVGRFWKPNGYPRGTICLIHGIGEHSNRYDAWARRFCEQGLMVYAVDLRGHGHSEGKRGYIEHLSNFLDDMDSIVRRCKRNWGDLPGFIYGHSMGGALVLSYLLKRRQDFAGAIITAPWLQLVAPPKPILQKMVRTMDTVWPRASFSTGIKSSQLTRLVKEQDKSESDPLMHHRISIRLFNQLNEAAKDILNHERGFNLPLFFAHGQDDPITRFEVTRDFAKRVGGEAAFFALPGARHEVHREPNADELFDHLMQWMGTKLKKSWKIQSL